MESLEQRGRNYSGCISEFNKSHNFKINDHSKKYYEINSYPFSIVDILV